MKELKIPVKIDFTEKEYYTYVEKNTFGKVVRDVFTYVFTNFMIIFWFNTTYIVGTSGNSKFGVPILVIASVILFLYTCFQLVHKSLYNIQQYGLVKKFCLKGQTSNVYLTGIMLGYKQSMLTLKNELTGDIYTFSIPGYISPRDCNGVITVGLNTLCLENIHGDMLHYKFI